MLKTCQPVLRYEFGPFRLDAVKRLLLRDNAPVHLPPKAFDTLLVLVENHGRVVEKTELINQVWPDSFVEEINLTVYISMLRKTLGDRTDAHQYIVTSPRRGYSFVAPVNPVGADDLSAANQPREVAEALRLAEAPRPANGVAILPPAFAPSSVPNGAGEHRVVASATGMSDQAAPVLSPAAAPTRGWRDKRLALLVLIGAAVVLLSFWVFGKRQPHPAPTPRSIAVLPFKTLGTPSEATLELGMADALIMRLSRLEQITVRPSNAIFAYAGKNYDPVEAGHALKVDAVMLGTIQQTNERIRVSVQLINVSDGRPFWVDQFDEERANIFAMQDSISEQVMRALSLKLNDKEVKQLAQRQTENLEAYRAYSRGLYFWTVRSDEALQKSIKYFQQAIDIDPRYGLAYAGLADSSALIADRSTNETVAEEYFTKAKAAALKALEIDESLAEAHTALALVKGAGEGDSWGAEKEHQRALELNPNYATGHQRFAWFLVNRGQLNRAAQEMRLAAELDPVSKVNNAAWVNLLYFLGQSDQAIEQCLKVLELAPDYDSARYLLGLAYEQKGQYKQALETIEQYGDTNKDDPLYYGTLGHIYAVSGQPDEAHRMIRELEKLDARTTERGATYCIALVYAGLGDKDRVFAWLEEGARARAMSWIRFRYDPRFAEVRKDPRFKNFLRLREEIAKGS